MSMESSSIELKVFSCTDLKAFNFFQKLLVYALVSMVSDDPDKKLEQSQQQRTPTDREGDGNPEWNLEMQFDLNKASFQDCSHLYIQVDLRHEGLLFGDKPIGEVRVPLKDLIQEFNGVVRFVSYEVRTADGIPNGVLNFSYKVNGKCKFAVTDSSVGQITGFPMVYHHHHQHQSPEIQHPLSDGHSASEQVYYPSLELETASQETYSAPQESMYSSPGTMYPSLENYYPPPVTYFPPSAPIPPPLQPRPPPDMAHGAYGYPPCPPQVYPWAPDPYVGLYGYSMNGTWGPIAGHEHLFDGGERWPNGRQG